MSPTRKAPRKDRKAAVYDAAREVVLAYRQRFARNERPDSLFGPIDSEIIMLEAYLGPQFIASGILSDK